MASRERTIGLRSLSFPSNQFYHQLRLARRYAVRQAMLERGDPVQAKKAKEKGGVRALKENA
jgi:Tfp pilus assembly protein FimT